MWGPISTAQGTSAELLICLFSCLIGLLMTMVIMMMVMIMIMKNMLSMPITKLAVPPESPEILGGAVVKTQVRNTNTNTSKGAVVKIPVRYRNTNTITKTSTNTIKAGQLWKPRSSIPWWGWTYDLHHHQCYQAIVIVNIKNHFIIISSSHHHHSMWSPSFYSGGSGGYSRMYIKRGKASSRGHLTMMIMMIIIL